MKLISDYDLNKHLTECRDHFKYHEVVWRVADSDRNVTVLRFSRPGTNIYAMTVSIVPGAIMVTGDCGELTLTPGYGRSMDWFLSSVDNLDYFCGKISQDMDAWAFDLKAGIEWLKEEVRVYEEEADSPDQPSESLRPEAIALGELEDDSEITTDKFFEILYESGVDDPPHFKVPNFHTINIVVGLQALAKVLASEASKSSPNTSTVRQS
jgi:hypothetical protein